MSRSDRGWTPRHTKEELNQMAVRAQTGDDRAKTTLAKMMRPYVISLVQSFDGTVDTRADSDDIKGAAWLGVWVALEKFDPDKGTKFSSYAYFWMRHEVQMWMSKNTTALPLSSRAWKASKALREAWEKKHPGRDFWEATDEELEELEVDIPHMRELIDAKGTPSTLDPEIDPELERVRSSQSAEGEYLEVEYDMDTDALETMERMREMSLEEAHWEAMAFCNRHGLDTRVADRMVGEMT